MCGALAMSALPNSGHDALVFVTMRSWVSDAHSLGCDLKAFSDEPPAFQACLIVVCALVRPLAQFDLRPVNFFTE